MNPMVFVLTMAHIFRLTFLSVKPDHKFHPMTYRINGWEETVRKRSCTVSHSHYAITLYSYIYIYVCVLSHFIPWCFVLYRHMLYPSPYHPFSTFFLLKSQCWDSLDPLYPINISILSHEQNIIKGISTGISMGISIISIYHINHGNPGYMINMDIMGMWYPWDISIHISIIPSGKLTI